jgi:pentalenolactone synthase
MDDHAVVLAAGLLFAGHETTVAAIDKGVLPLNANPSAREALQRDPALISKAVEELLRSAAPLARIELQTLFGTLIKRFPTLRLAVPVAELRQRRYLLTGGLAELPVTW